MPENFEPFVLAVGMVGVEFVCGGGGGGGAGAGGGGRMGYKLHDYDLRPKIRMSVSNG